MSWRASKSGRWLLSFLCVCISDAGTAADHLLPEYPGAEVESRRLASPVSNYLFVLSAVERASGEMRSKRSLRLDGTASGVTYRIPTGISPDEVVNHYRDALGTERYEILFECRARDCGKSTVWANSVFKQATLYGPDTNQRYLAARRDHDAGEQLVAVYVTRRGNRKVYAHVESVVSERGAAVPVASTASTARTDVDDVVAALARDGSVRLQGIRPGMSGVLDEAALARLVDVGRQLRVAAQVRLVVVCHIYGPGNPEALLEASERCAEQARANLDPDRELELRPFGAGSFAPQTGQRRESRVELVTP